MNKNDYIYKIAKIMKYKGVELWKIQYASLSLNDKLLPIDYELDEEEIERIIDETLMKVEA